MSFMRAAPVHADVVSLWMSSRNSGEKPNGFCAYHTVTLSDKWTLLMPFSSALTTPKSPAPKSACV